ncbi:MAG: hypothetical protein JST64_05685, partial [Actinobacteria bacterium]|nr:hypothetical protein [Actinomycetota bacterium]
MAADMLTSSARVIAGDLAPGEFGAIGLNDAPQIHELDDDLAFVAAFSNVAAFRSPGDDDLLLVDVSSRFHGAAVADLVRSWTSAPLRTAV